MAARRFAALASCVFAFALLLAAPSLFAANNHLTPSWMKVDTAAKHVALDIVAGFNANNGALNFNGYFAGDMSVIVPIGWTVTIHFRNNDAMLPHSLVVTKAFTKGHFPDRAGVDQVAIPRAYTNNPDQGIPSPGGDTVTFKTEKPGNYYFLCGAAGHGQAGMWVNFKVDAAAAVPYVSVSPGAAAGRP
jgi:sulfocyanin